MLTNKEIQTYLVKAGYDVGKAGVDGFMGRDTIEAIKRFQADHGLKVKWPGTFGPMTEAELIRVVNGGGVITPYASLPWYEEAKRLGGIKEIPGSKSNPVILGWAKTLGGWIKDYYTNDDIPWCGLFVAHCITNTLPGESIPSNPLSALAWQKFGVECTPQLGAILVFSRNGGGHVGFYVGEDDEAFHVLGGNQSNMVNVTRVAKSRLVAARWPSTAQPSKAGKRVFLKASTRLSVNEA